MKYSNTRFIIELLKLYTILLIQMFCIPHKMGCEVRVFEKVKYPLPHRSDVNLEFALLPLIWGRNRMRNEL